MGTNSEEEARFLRAAERMRSNSSLNLNNDQKLELYGYFKQVLFTYLSRLHVYPHKHPNRPLKAGAMSLNQIFLILRDVRNGV